MNSTLPSLAAHETRADHASAIVHIHALSKTYRVHERPAGLGASLVSLVRRTFKEVRAVSDVTFDIQPGEIVGFLGPNGAGKTTTLKMLAGLLHPTSGDATVMGFSPWRRETDYLRSISLVMGNRNQLNWDIPAMDSFLVNQVIYQIPKREFRETLDELVELLDLGDLLTKPVRGLSLGERMKCELAAALLHRPKVLFLDEPTLGVDVTMQGRIRRFVGDYNRRTGATVLLTSHYMADVTALCKRVVVIHRGRLLYDGDLEALADRIMPFKVIRLDVQEQAAAERLALYGEAVEVTGLKASLRVPRADTPAIVGRILAEVPVLDLTVEDPPIEDVIDLLFNATDSDGSAQS
ncbi:MAG: ATP-binding cassette domain-containing protein [Chthonomonadales bacterium]|nr:ATP-binding cassette domain-containing protein [Chthonomonadales bacterium]